MATQRRERLLALVEEARRKAPRPPHSAISVTSADNQPTSATRRLTETYDPMISGDDNDNDKPQTPSKARKPRKKRKSRPDATDTQPLGVDGDTPPPKKTKVRGKGKGKAVEMLEGEEVPEGYTTRMRAVKINWKDHKPHFAYMKEQYPSFLALSGRESTNFAKAVGSDMFDMFDWGKTMHDDVQRVVLNWMRNQRQKDKEQGVVTTTQAGPKTKNELSPFFQKLRGRAPAASQLWAKEHKAQIDDALANGQYKTRQEAVGAMFAALQEDEQRVWSDKVEATENAKKNNPDASFNNQKFLRDTLYTTLNNFSGSNWDQFGVVGFQVLYAYRDRDNQMHNDQLTAGSFDEHDGFMLDDTSFDEWALEHLPMNSDPRKRDDRQYPRLPGWDDDWNRTQLCDVLKTFFTSVCAYEPGHSGEQLDYARLKDSPTTYIPSSWLDAGIPNVDAAKFGPLQALYERICDAQDTNDRFQFLSPSVADSHGRASTPGPSTPADQTVIDQSPSRQPDIVRSPSPDEHDVLDTTPKQFPVPTAHSDATGQSSSSGIDMSSTTGQRSPVRRALSSEVDRTTLRGSIPPPLDSPTFATLDMPVDSDPIATETEPEIDQLLTSDAPIADLLEEPVENAHANPRDLANDGQAEEPGTLVNGQGDEEQEESDDKADEHTASSLRRSSRKREGEVLETVATGTASSKRQRTSRAVDAQVASTTSTRTTRSKAAASVVVPTVRVTRARAKATSAKAVPRGRTT